MRVESLQMMSRYLPVFFHKCLWVSKETVAHFFRTKMRRKSLDRKTWGATGGSLSLGELECVVVLAVHLSVKFGGS